MSLDKLDGNYIFTRRGLYGIGRDVLHEKISEYLDDIHTRFTPRFIVEIDDFGDEMGWTIRHIEDVFDVERTMRRIANLCFDTTINHEYIERYMLEKIEGVTRVGIVDFRDPEVPDDVYVDIDTGNGLVRRKFNLVETDGKKRLEPAEDES